jgi:hypothetical protein
MISGAIHGFRAYALESSGICCGANMPHRRKSEKGSFGGHFDELVTQFPAGAGASSEREVTKRSRELQDKVDVHALLFERAWKLDSKG